MFRFSGPPSLPYLGISRTAFLSTDIDGRAIAPYTLVFECQYLIKEYDK